MIEPTQILYLNLNENDIIKIQSDIEPTQILYLNTQPPIK